MNPNNRLNPKDEREQNKKRKRNNISPPESRNDGDDPQDSLNAKIT